MVAFDIRTIIHLLALGNLTAFLVLVAYSRPDIHREPYSLFMAGKLVQCPAWVLLGLRGLIPEFASVHGANALLMAGFALEAMALGTAGRPAPRLKAALALTAGVGFGIFWAFGRTPNLRVSLASLVTLALFGTGAWAMLRHAGPSRLQRWLGLFYGITALLMGVRVCMPVMGGGEFALLTRHPVQTLVFLPLYLLMLGGATGFLLLIKEQDDARVLESEAKFRALFRASPDAVLLTRRSDGTVQEVNRSFERLTGFSAAEVIGKTTLELGFFGSPEVREVLLRDLRQGGVENWELSFQKRSGESRTGLLSSEAVILHGEEILVSSVRDITERKGLELERERMIRELQTALQDIKTLSGLLPICAACKKIRDDKGYWNQLELYIQEHSQVAFTHGMCPDCMREYFPELRKEPPAEGKA